jgi:hypothetical protein
MSSCEQIVRVISLASRRDNAFTDMAEFHQLAITGTLTYSRSIQQRDIKGGIRELETQKESSAYRQRPRRSSCARNTGWAASYKLHPVARRVRIA